MSLKEKREKLASIYARFENRSSEFKENAICKAGCAFCCTDVGNVDVTTLEGSVIRDRLAALPKPQRKQFRKNRTVSLRNQGVKRVFAYLISH